MLDSQHKALTDKVASLTEELSSICVEWANLRSDLSEMTVLVQGLEEDVGRSLSGVSMVVQVTYENMVDAVIIEIQKNLADEWKKTETHFQVETARIAVIAGGGLLRRSSDVQWSLRKS